MIIKSSEFVKSSPEVAGCPAPGMPEYAFLGRSNVGKSSLINMITGHKKLAKTSSTPGKTQLINHFIINDNWYLADLPGYGYAKASKKARHGWQQMIRSYLLRRTNLLCSFILIDSRIPSQASDMDLLSWFGNNGLPFVLVFTKTDKLKPRMVDAQVLAITDEMMKEWESLPPVFITSSQTGKGKEDILDFIEDTNRLFK